MCTNPKKKPKYISNLPKYQFKKKYILGKCS